MNVNAVLTSFFLVPLLCFVYLLKRYMIYIIPFIMIVLMMFLKRLMILFGVLKCIDMLVENKSNRASVYSKLYNSVLSPHGFIYQSKKRTAYAQRLYFEYQYTLKVGGSAFFYTLTYNDAHIPKYLGMNVFSYVDIRKVTHGMMEKVLKRKYGSRLRYFCACETGEGKGSRGIGNNPHYHFIFFVQPECFENGRPNPSFKLISPVEFRKLVRRQWMGKTMKYKLADYGIAKEGDFLGLVTNAAAFKYVSKYVLKDNIQKDVENKVYEYHLKVAKHQGISHHVLWSYYIVNREESDLSCKWQFDEMMFNFFGLHQYNVWRKSTTAVNTSYEDYVQRYCDDVSIKQNFAHLICWYEDYYKKFYAYQRLKEFRNLYGGKVRCSKSLGEYGLNFVLDPYYEPQFSIPSSDGYDVQSIALYYYRKLYYDTYKCDVSGNVLYRLNKRGIELHVNSLDRRISQFRERVRENISVVFNQNLPQFKEFRENSALHESLESPIYRYYAIYKLVYEFRTFNPKTDFTGPSPLWEFDICKRDYERFLQNDSYWFDWDIQTVLFKRKRAHFNAIDYCNHDVIHPYIKFFKFLDELNDAVDNYRSECSKTRFTETAELQKRHKASIANQSI